MPPTASQQAFAAFCPIESSIDTDPASPFWSLCDPLLLNSDIHGIPRPHLLTEVCVRWTFSSLYSSSPVPIKSSTLIPLHNLRRKPTVSGTGMWPKSFSVPTKPTFADIKNLRSRPSPNGSISMSTSTPPTTCTAGPQASRPRLVSTRLPWFGRRSCGFHMSPWTRALPR